MWPATPREKGKSSPEKKVWDSPHIKMIGQEADKVKIDDAMVTRMARKTSATDMWEWQTEKTYNRERTEGEKERERGRIPRRR